MGRFLGKLSRRIGIGVLCLILCIIMFWELGSSSPELIVYWEDYVDLPFDAQRFIMYPLGIGYSVVFIILEIITTVFEGLFDYLERKYLEKSGDK